jgi:SAM-dependent methyltransferase
VGGPPAHGGQRTRAILKAEFVRRLRRLGPVANGGPQPEEGSPRRASDADGPSLWALLERYIPNDHARQVNATYYIDRLMERPDAPRRVLDLGCGRGDSVDQFRLHSPGVEWIGVDIAGSQEVQQRRRSDATFVTYDGERVPFPNGSFDLVYSRQVLEHVPDPLGHLREITRVLRNGGAFIGSTSQLEPYHSMSYWNFTPVGFVALAERAGLRVLELRPGIDGVTLPLRTYLGRPTGFDAWWTADSPLNQAIDEWGRETRRRPALINLRKLHLCGQFAFHAVREGM